MKHSDSWSEATGPHQYGDSFPAQLVGTALFERHSESLDEIEITVYYTYYSMCKMYVLLLQNKHCRGSTMVTSFEQSRSKHMEADVPDWGAALHKPMLTTHSCHLNMVVPGLLLPGAGTEE